MGFSFRMLWAVVVVLGLGLFALVALGRVILRDKEDAYRLEEYSFVDPTTQEEHIFDTIYTEPKKYLSVVIPAYNEEERISVMLDETLGYLQDRQRADPQFTWELVIVDDGSRDQTVSLVQSQYVKKYGTDLIRVNKLRKNVGKGGAVRRGCLVARGQYILMADADGATRFSDLLKLENSLHNIQRDQRGVVVGSRAQYHEEASESERRPGYRNISHLVFALLVDTLCVKGIKDTQCGFKLFTRRAVQELFLSLHIERWAFDVEVLYIAQRKGIPVGEEIVQWAEIDGSHLSVFSASIQMAKDILRVPILYRLGYWKFHSP